MEDRNYIHHEGDALDRELNALVREMEQEEVIRRAVIDMLVMLGSDEMLEHDVQKTLEPFAIRWVGENYNAPQPIALYGLMLLFASVAYFILTKALIAHHCKRFLI